MNDPMATNIVNVATWVGGVVSCEKILRPGETQRERDMRVSMIDIVNMASWVCGWGGKLWEDLERYEEGIND